MFSVLGPSVDRLDPTELASLGEDAVAHLPFRGLDGNDALESRMLAYAKYLIETGRWTNLAGYFEQNDGGNSHWRTLPAYQRMLEAYTPLYMAKVRARVRPRSPPARRRRAGPGGPGRDPPGQPPGLTRRRGEHGQVQGHPGRKPKRGGR